jgi:hypothetical protein
VSGVDGLTTCADHFHHAFVHKRTCLRQNEQPGFFPNKGQDTLAKGLVDPPLGTSILNGQIAN